MTTSDRLEEILAEDPSKVRLRLQSGLDRIAGETQPALVLFGAGLLGQRTLRTLRGLGLRPWRSVTTTPRDGAARWTV